MFRLSSRSGAVDLVARRAFRRMMLLLRWLQLERRLRPLPFQLPHPLFHLFAGFEGDYVLLGDVNFVTSSGVSRLSSRPLLDLEHAKGSQFDPLLFDQRVDDSIKCFLDDALGFELGQTDFFGNRFDDLFLGHNAAPVGQGKAEIVEAAMPPDPPAHAPSVDGTTTSVKLGLALLPSAMGSQDARIERHPDYPERRTCSLSVCCQRTYPTWLGRGNCPFVVNIYNQTVNDFTHRGGAD